MTGSELTSAESVAIKDTLQRTGRKILIVDDSDINLALMQEMLHRMGHEIDMAKNGESAVNKVRQTPYDIILMDFSMPVMDGPTAAERIRALETGPRPLAIIGVTALIDANMDLNNNTLFDQILIKPVGFAQLAATIDAIVASHTQPRSTPSPQASPALTEIEASAVTAHPSLNRGFERQNETISTAFNEIMSLVGKDTAIQLLQASFSDVDLAISTITNRSLKTADMTAPTHKAVGSTAILGLEELSGALFEAEKMALKGSDPNLTELPKLISALLEEAKIEFAPLIADHVRLAKDGSNGSNT